MRTIAAILVLAATACAAEPKVHRGLPYAEPGSELQTLDVYAPAEGKNLPVVVWIHGGGWHSGDKSDVEKKPQALLDKGFVFVSINYRLFPTVTIKQIAADVAKAIRWTSDHIREYGGDPRAHRRHGPFRRGATGRAGLHGRQILEGRGDPPVRDQRHAFRSMATATTCRCRSRRWRRGRRPAKRSHSATRQDRRNCRRSRSSPKGKRAASCRIKFGDEALQKELSAVTLRRQGEEHSALPGASRCRPPGNQSAIATARQGARGSGHSGNGVSGRREEPHHDQCRLGLAKRPADPGTARVLGCRAKQTMNRGTLTAPKRIRFSRPAPSGEL